MDDATQADNDSQSTGDVLPSDEYTTPKTRPGTDDVTATDRSPLSEGLDPLRAGWNRFSTTSTIHPIIPIGAATGVLVWLGVVAVLFGILASLGMLSICTGVLMLGIMYHPQGNVTPETVFQRVYYPVTALIFVGVGVWFAL